MIKVKQDIKALHNKIQHNLLRHLHLIAYLKHIHSGELECWLDDNTLKCTIII
jgi:hypothetical protein